MISYDDTPGERRFQKIVEYNKDHYALMDEHGKIIYSNRAIEGILGYSVEEYMQLDTRRLIHPDDWPQAQEFLQSLLAAPGITRTIEIRYRHRDGHYIWMEVNATNLLHDPDIGAIVSTSRDITESKQARNALVEERKLLRTLVDALPDPIYVKDPDSRFLLTNLSHTRLIGAASPDEVIGRTDFDFFPRELAGQYYADEQMVIQSGKALINREENTVDYQGNRLVVSTTRVPFRDSQGRIIGIVGITRDITERKKAEEALSAKLAEEQEFQQYLKALHEITIELTQINELDDFYKRAVELGRERLEFDRMALFLYDMETGLAIGTYGTDAAGKLVSEHHLRFRPAVATGLFMRALQQKERFIFDEAVPLYSNLQPVDTGWNAAAALWNGNESLGWLAVDNALHHQPASKSRLEILALYGLALGRLLAQKRTEVSLRQALEREQELSELKSRFISTASHEFRTPLATILASAESLAAYRHRMNDDQVNRKLAKITGHVGHLRDIIEDVLQLERIQSGRIEFNPAECDLDALCKDIIEEFQNAPDVTHELVYTTGQVTPVLRLDNRLMRQAISNLISNALKYSPAGQSVYVRLECRDGATILSVQDSGIGIPEADLKHLFEPFHRATNVGTISGTGLGLSITKQAIELHGGTIAVKSQVGAGTTFTVTIPFPAQDEERGLNDEQTGV